MFKLLCDPGDAVLVPRPSYPLFENLTRLEGVDPIPYPLEYHGRWEIDLAAAAARATSRTRAILVVNPNNPTGSFVTPAEWDGMAAVCRERGLALIVDEVFGRYPIVAKSRGPSVLDRPSDVLTFVLGGLSKAVGLPQLKLGWIVLAGPADDVSRARERLAFIADMYLPVGTPVQLALSSLLDAGGAVTTQIATRIRTNHAALRTVVDRHPAAQMLRVDGGWYAVVQVPAIRTEEHRRSSPTPRRGSLPAPPRTPTHERDTGAQGSGPRRRRAQPRHRPEAARHGSDAGCQGDGDRA